jgi:DNA-binding MarR family transcriptional regulator
MEMDESRGAHRESAAKWISVLHRQFQMYLNRELKPYGIRSSEYIFLVNLYEKDGVSQETLSRNLYINKAATARAIGRLEKLGLVRRTRDAADARAYAVTLTPEGMKLKGVIQELLRRWRETLEAGLTEEECEFMLRTIKRMSANALALVEAARKDADGEGGADDDD